MRCEITCGELRFALLASTVATPAASPLQSNEEPQQCAADLPEEIQLCYHCAHTAIYPKLAPLHPDHTVKGRHPTTAGLKFKLNFVLDRYNMIQAVVD